MALLSVPEKSRSADPNLADNWAGLTKAEQDEARKSMDSLGIAVRRARAILKSYAGGKYLRRGVGAALALNFQLSSLEQTDRALRWVVAQAENKDRTMPERIEILKTVADLQESIRRMCESALRVEGQFTAAQKPPPAPPSPEPEKPPVSRSIANIDFMPAVATNPARRIGPVDENGERVL